MAIQFSSALTLLSGTWSVWKTRVLSKGLTSRVQFDDDGALYTIFAIDGPLAYTCLIWKGAVPDSVVQCGYSQEQNDIDKTDFETNFLAGANAPIDSRTVDGRLCVRTSSTNRMNNFKLRAITFYTSELLEGLHNVNPVTGLSYGDVSMQLFKANGDEILTEEDEIYAVKTVLNFDPTYDYEIIGGYMDTPTSIKDGVTDQWFISAIGVPDYPPEYYGSVDFISEVNLEAITVQRVVSDGRAISFMPYNAGGNPYTNRLRLIIKHPVGERKRFQFFIEHFTP